MADDNAGGTNNASVGLGSAGSGQTGQVDAGKNPIDPGVQGNDTSKVNDALGTKAATGDADDKGPSTEAGKGERKSEGDLEHYDAASGALRKGSVTLTDENGVTVTKTAG